MSSAPQAASNQVVMETSEGQIVLELDADRTPITVQNFLQYVDEQFYDGTIFHRVIEGFMIQGGGFTEANERAQKATRPPIKNEAKQGNPNARGTIAMARTNDPDSATCQFFINHKDNAFLNPGPAGAGYCVFGRVVSGMDVVDKIAALPQAGGRGAFENITKPVVEIRSVKRK